MNEIYKKLHLSRIKRETYIITSIYKVIYYFLINKIRRHISYCNNKILILRAVWYRDFDLEICPTNWLYWSILMIQNHSFYFCLNKMYMH